MPLNFFTISSASLILTSLVLLIILLIYGKTKLHRICFLFNVVVLMWGSGLFLVSLASITSQALIGWKIAVGGGLFISVFFYHTVYILAELNKKKVLILVYLQAVVFLLLSTFGGRTPIYGNMQLVFNSFFYPAKTIGWTLMVLSWAIVAGMGHYELFKFVKNSKGMHHVQGLYLLSGFAIGFLGGGSVTLPSWGISLYPIGNFGIVIYSIVMTYAILRYNLLDVNVVVGRIKAFLVIFGIPLIGFRVARPFIGDNLSLIVAFVLLLFMLKIVDKAIFQKERIRREALTKASKDAVKLIYLEPLLYKMNRSVYKIFELEHSSVFRLLKRDNTYKVAATRGKNSIPINTTLAADHSLILWFNRLANRLVKAKFLSEKDVSFLTIEAVESWLQDERLQRRSQIKKTLQDILQWMSSYSVSLCVPSYYGGDLKGFLATGEAKAGQLMQEDLDALSNLANETAVAVTNAELFEEKEVAHKKIEHNLFQTILSLAQTVDKRDEYTAEHSESVSYYSVEIAKEMGLSSERIEILKTCALLHDIGKIGISDEILKGQTKLTPRERKIIQEHPDKGVDILAPIEDLKAHLKIIRHHHERFDGAGYPDGLKAEEIPLESRILALADTYDALTTTRTYRKARTAREALVEVMKCTYFQSPQFDSVIVEAFLNFLKKTPVKKFLLTGQELEKIRQEAEDEE